MGKNKRNKQKNKKKHVEMFEGIESICEATFDHMGVKNKSKLSKKQQKRLMRQMQQDAAKSHKKHKRKGEEDHKALWHEVKVTCECEVDRQFLLTSIGAYVDTPFCPMGYHKMSSHIIFYLESNKDVADAIGSLDKRIQAPNKEIMKISVQPVPVPDLVLNADQLVVLKDVLAQRYNPSLSLLDLSHLHMDPVLVKLDYLVPLANPLIMKQVLKIIKENVPTIKALNLAKNSLQNEALRLLQSLMDGACTLSALNLGNNMLQSFQFLKHINMFPLMELTLDSNDALNVVKNPMEYIKIVRKNLPLLKKLDGIDIDEYVVQNQGSFKLSKLSPFNLQNVPSSSTQQQTAPLSKINVTEENMKAFLEQYYSIIDTPERVNLLQAYTPQSTVSINSSINLIPSATFCGPSDIENFLKTFPETKHIHSSFALDVAGANTSEGIAQVKGKCYFKGVSESEPVNFVRKMTLVSFNSGICCLGDAFEINGLIA